MGENEILAQQWKGADLKTKRKIESHLVKKNIKLFRREADYISKKFGVRDGHYEFDEIVNLVIITFIKKVLPNYNIGRVKLMSYAAFWSQQTAWTYFKNNDNVKVPTEIIRDGGSKKNKRRYYKSISLNAENEFGKPLIDLVSEKENPQSEFKKIIGTCDLDQRQKKILILKYADQWSTEEIAIHLNLSKEGVRQILEKAHKKIKREIIRDRSKYF